MNVQLPVVLFLDGHVSHISLPLSEFCKKHGIILIALLPNSTHLLQPMDVGVFHCLKTAWKKEVQDWRITNNGQRMKREDFGPAIEKCMKSSITTDVIQSAFRACGLYPFNEDAVAYNKILKTTMECPMIAGNVEAVIRSEEEQPPQSNLIKLFEERLEDEKLKLINECDGLWAGDIKDENLYYFWKKMKNEQGGYGNGIASLSGFTSLLAGGCSSIDIANMGIDFLDLCELCNIVKFPAAKKIINNKLG